MGGLRGEQAQPNGKKKWLKYFHTECVDNRGKGLIPEKRTGRFQIFLEIRTSKRTFYAENNESWNDSHRLSRESWGNGEIMKNITLFGLLLGCLTAAASGHARSDLWVDGTGSSKSPRISIPSLAPLVKARESAVLVVNTWG